MGHMNVAKLFWCMKVVDRIIPPFGNSLIESDNGS